MVDFFRGAVARGDGDDVADTDGGGRVVDEEVLGV